MVTCFWNSGSQNMAVGPEVQHHLGTQRCRFSDFTLNPLNQQLQGWNPAICVVTSLPRDSDALKLVKTVFAIKCWVGWEER